MKAAVVHSFDQLPSYEDFADPVARGEHEEVVEVLAAALHPRVRSSADGSHYESTGQLPLIPGIDGVGRAENGELIYFVLPDTLMGSMAERVVIDRRRCAVLPDGVDPVTVAAAMNPAMSSWIALRSRTTFRPGQNVLVLGATGNAGQLAVQITKHLGAGQTVAAGRDPVRLSALEAIGADRLVSLAGEAEAVDQALAKAVDESDIDVVIDYLWGSVAQRAIPAILKTRSDRSRPLDWIQIGSMAGPDITLPSEWLRAARLQLLGSGQGSVSTRKIVDELPAIAVQMSTGDYVVNAVPTDINQVESAWARPDDSGERIVFTFG